MIINKINKNGIKKSVKKYGALALLGLTLGVAPFVMNNVHANASQIYFDNTTFTAPVNNVNQIQKKHTIKIVKKTNNKVIYKVAKHHKKHNVRHISLSASHVQPTAKNKKLSLIQSKHQKKVNAKVVRKHAKRANLDKGLTKADKRARATIVYEESRGEWTVSNGRCYGRFQLLPGYLGYVHGHLNLNHKHQIKTANAYVAHRYGNWVNALRFHNVHHWY